jgi:hypothetical protein
LLNVIQKLLVLYSTKQVALISSFFETVGTDIDAAGKL